MTIFVDDTQDLTLLYDEFKYLLYLSFMYTLVWWGFFLCLLMVPYLCIKIRTVYSIRCCKFMTSLNHRTI